MLTAIRECASELGRCPTLAELMKFKKVGQSALRGCFGSYTQALREAGLDPLGSGHPTRMEDLFADWAQIARQLGRLPSQADFQERSRYSYGPLRDRFGGWRQVPAGMLRFAHEKGLEAEWKDVVEMILAQERSTHPTEPPLWTARLKKGKPLYGLPLHSSPLAHAPTNEMGVVYLFGTLAPRLGIIVTRMQQGFPDCEAMLQVEEDQWQQLRLEFEYESRNFLNHRHDADQCDLIVCWVHNWPECPKNLDVLELSRVVR